MPLGNGYLVAGDPKMAPQPDYRLESQFQRLQLVAAQRAGILVPRVYFDVGNLWNLSFLADSI